MHKVVASVFRRHLPSKHHPARARHGQQVAIPGVLCGVALKVAVGAMAVDEVCEVGERLVATTEARGLQPEIEPTHPGLQADEPSHRSDSTVTTLCLPRRNYLRDCTRPPVEVREVHPAGRRKRPCSWSQNGMTFAPYPKAAYTPSRDHGQCDLGRGPRTEASPRRRRSTRT